MITVREIPRAGAESIDRAWHSVSVDGDTAHGLAIVGMSETGKTTLRNIIAKSWKSFDAEGHVFDFSVSDGHRGYTADVLVRNGVDLSSPLDRRLYAKYLDEYTNGSGYSDEDLEKIIANFYHNPQPPGILRSTAVTSVVAYTSEHPDIRPRINAVGASYLRDVLENPDLKNFDAKPTLVVLDARNMGECTQKFSMAGVAMLGTCVLTCPERVVAARKRTDPAEQLTEERRLKRRNRTDRNRQLGRMTLPIDLSRRFVVDTMLRKSNKDELLARAGYAVAEDNTAGVVIRSDRTSIKDEAYAMDKIMAGMLARVEEQRVFGR